MKSMNRRVSWAGVCLGLVLVTGCGSEVSDEKVCESFQTVVDLQAQLSIANDAILADVMNETMVDPENVDMFAVSSAFATLSGEVESKQLAMFEAYRRAAESASPELSESILKMVEYQEYVLPFLVEWFGQVDSLEDLETFDSILGNDQRALELAEQAQAAAAAVDQYAISTCGFAVAGS